MKKITILFAFLITAISFGQNFVALGQIKGLATDSEACEAGGKGFVSYPKDWYTGSGVVIDELYAGESSDANWKLDYLISDASFIYFNGEVQLRAAYASSNTDITSMISINNTTDFTLKAYNKRATSTSTLIPCIDGGTGNKILRYSLMLNAALNPNDVRSVTIKITDKNAFQENILLTVTAATSLTTKDLSLVNFSYGPNPASDEVNLSAAKPIEFVEISNFSGQKVISQQLNETNASVDIANLAPGIYLMTITVDGSKGTYKIIKE